MHQDGEAQAAWKAMCHLIEVVNRGGSPHPMPPTVLVGPDEAQYGSLLADGHVFTGADVEYTTGGYAFGGGLLFTAAGMAAGAAMDANRRRRAEAMARPQWRPLGRVPVVVTTRRMLVMVEGQWSIYYLTGLVSFHPDLPNWLATFHFEGGPPLMLRGPWVPWLSVVVSAVLFSRPWPPGYLPPPALRALVAGPPPSQAIPRQPAPQQRRPELPPGSPG